MFYAVKSNYLILIKFYLFLEADFILFISVMHMDTYTVYVENLKNDVNTYDTIQLNCIGGRIMVLENQKIIPHLWFDKEAKEAVQFYTAIFPDSKMIGETIVQDTPSGDANVVSFQLWGQRFMAINGGPHFSFNPSISFFINIDPSRIENAKETVQKFWDYLSQDGQVLMPLDRYPFSEKYGWIQDKYGVSWQIILSNPDGDDRPPIVPSLMFIGENNENAEEAIHFYTSVFQDSKVGHIARRPKGMELEKEGTIMFADFMVENKWFAAMESSYPHGFTFNEAISFMVYCKNQQELDHYWESLTAVPEAEQCGWLKDKYGLSWQIVTKELHEMLLEGTSEEVYCLNQEILKMKKIDMERLRKVNKES